MFGRPPANFGPPGPFPGPGQFPPFMQPPRTGGFLSRLFGGAARPGMGGMGGIPGSQFFGMTNTGGQGFLGAMQNVEKMIQLAQTVRPMVEQYGPMIKNIPSMLELLKEYKSYSADKEQNEETTNETTTKNNETKNKETKTSTKTNKKTSPIKEETNQAPEKKIQAPKGVKIVPKKANINNSKPIQKVEYKVSKPKLYI